MCTNGSAGDFPCSGITLRKRVPYESMDGPSGSDIWGWFDALTGNEYALMGMENGTAFVDITNPDDPVFLGRLPTQTVEDLVRDIKVYKDHAYIVAGSVPHGMQVFDLTRLRGLMTPQTFTADVVYGDFGNAHNIAINEDSGFAYAVSMATRRFCPAESLRPGTSARAVNSKASSARATAVVPWPWSAAQNVKFSAAVRTGFTASRWPR